MISRTHGDFWTFFNALPAEVQEQARERFRLWQQDAFNPALHFKPLLAQATSMNGGFSSHTTVTGTASLNAPGPVSLTARILAFTVVKAASPSYERSC